MANFWDSIINNVVSNPVIKAGMNILHISKATAVAADPKLQQTKQAEDQAAATAAATDSSGQVDQQKVDSYLSDQKEKDDAAAAAAQAVADAADQFTIIKEHVLTDDDMLSALALHFYGHATPEYWGLIILANKNTIGDKVSDYTPGKTIKIPALPDSMK